MVLRKFVMSSGKADTLELEIERILTSPDKEVDKQEGEIVAVVKKGGKKECKLSHACKVFKAHGATEDYIAKFCTNPHFVCTKCGRCGQRCDQMCYPAPIPTPSEQ